MIAVLVYKADALIITGFMANEGTEQVIKNCNRYSTMGFRFG
jgi:hypothetical protein